MSFLVKQPSNPQSALTDSEPRSSYAEAQTIPIGFGQHFYPSQWLCDAYHRRTAPAGQNQPEHQYASIAAKFCKGPIVYVGAIKRDGKIINNLNYTFGPTEDQHTFTIQAGMKGGLNWQLVLRRGTRTQTASAALRAATGQLHPAYSGDVWAEWINIPLGQGTTAIPDLQLELRSDVPEIGPFGGGAHTFYGANPIAAIYALAKETRGGLGAPDSLLTADHWGTQSVFLETYGVGGRTGSMTGCHPIITAPRSAGSVFSDILSYFDGYLYVEGAELKVGWFRNQAVDASTLPEIAEADLTEKPGGAGFADWNTSPVSAEVVFTEQGRYYNKTSESAPAPANAETGQLSTPVRKERPWIHTREQAAIIAAEIVNDAGSDDSGLTLNVLTSRLDAAGLVPGSVFRFDYGPHSLDLVCRVVSRRAKSASTSETITIIRERGAFPTPYVPPADERVEPTVDEPGEVSADDVRLWSVPAGLLSPGSVREIAVLINRGKLEITRAAISMSATGAEPWTDLQEQSFWAAKCTVSVAIDSSAGTVRVTSSSVDFAGMEAQDALAQQNDELLLVIDNEALSVGTIAAVSGNTCDLGVLRGRRGSTAAAHSNGAAAWLVRRSELQPTQHWSYAQIADGSGYSAALATKYFKVALATAGEQGLAKPDDPGLSITIPNPVGGSISDLTATAGTGRVVSLAWSALAGAVEYRIYRGTTSNPAQASYLNVEVAGTRYTDLGMTPGTWYYWVAPVSEDEVIGTKSNAASATVADVVEGGIDATRPANPAAPTLASSATKIAGDGTVTAKLVINLPAMPTHAVLLNVLYRTSGAAGWTVADQVDVDRRATQSTSTIDDLATNTAHEVAVQAFSAYGYPSAVVAATGSPFTTPVGPEPAAPTNFTSSNSAADLATVPPCFNGAGQGKFAATLLRWTASTSADVAFYEIYVVGAVFNRVALRTKGTETEIPAYLPVTFQQFSEDVYVRAVSRSGVRSALSNVLPLVASSTSYGSGSMAEQNATAIAVTGGSATGLSVVSAVEVIETSSRRYKRHIRPIYRPMTLLRKLQGIRFDQRKGGKRGRIGLPAEETSKVLPAMVRRDEQGRPDGVAYGPLVALVIEALKQQEREFGRELKRLKRELARLRGRKPSARLQRRCKPAADPKPEPPADPS